ncbi:hypothetical protein AVEN_211560-1 [Araneus ventricosus]|uniref:Uncharacterized protein n=1 Tax=Araneus ventricosus TaxID=182803 RepID=A0A4Y2D903_ARAVE|nr:hypothetical protein AVEN_211560-1 [Araneus ventricosus]
MRKGVLQLSEAADDPTRVCQKHEVVSAVVAASRIGHFGGQAGYEAEEDDHQNHYDHHHNHCKTCSLVEGFRIDQQVAFARWFQTRYGLIRTHIEYGLIRAHIEYGLIRTHIEYGLIRTHIEYGLIRTHIENTDSFVLTLNTD